MRQRWLLSLPTRRVMLAFALGLTAGVMACRSERYARPGDAVNQLYVTLDALGVSGAPTAQQLAALEPYLSKDLHDMLAAARTLSDSMARVAPGEKPPFVEGDLFSSMFEGPDSFGIGADSVSPPIHRVAVRMVHVSKRDTTRWVDHAIVSLAGKRWVVTDIEYGGTWDFGNKGSLVRTLASALGSSIGAATSNPLERQKVFDYGYAYPTGIGSLKVGMTLADARRIFSDTARIDRIEPGDRCGHAVFPHLPAGVSFMLSHDTIVRVDIDSATYTTSTGVGVGVTETEALKRLGPLARVAPHPYEGPVGHYLILGDDVDARFGMIFETNGKVITRFRVGFTDAVELIEGCA